VTTIIAAVFPPYFSAVAAAELPPPIATARFAMATTIALALVAICAPFLGALADYAAVRKKLLGVFAAIGMLATAGMYGIQRGEWVLAAVLFMVSDIGASGSFIFYDALLPHIATEEEMDRVSIAGYALGYLGGGLLLAINLTWIQQPRLFGIADAEAAARLSFLSVAVWWLVFSLPLFRSIPEPPRRTSTDTRGDTRVLQATWRQLRGTMAELRHYKQASLLLMAFVLYNDGIGTIIRMAAIYGTEIGIPQQALITAILLVQFVGLPCSFLFGAIAEYLGTKRTILLTLAVYCMISVFGYFMQTALHFYLLAFLIGLVQGGSQALSRSLFASMIPRSRSSQYFALFSICEKFAGLFGPAIFAGMVIMTGASRYALLSVIAFFVAGGTLLARVDVAEGQRAARETGDGREVTSALA
jgi:UMF1 family MFS transporter